MPWFFHGYTYACDTNEWFCGAQHKVVVLDTVAFHFRHGFEDYSQRTRALDALAGHLHRLATEFHIAVRRNQIDQWCARSRSHLN